MKTRNQDFPFEGTLIQYNDSGVTWLRANELYDVYKGMSPEDQISLNSTDLYFICKKPRLRIVEDSLYLKDGNLHIGFELSLKEGNKQEFWVIKNYPLTEAMFTVSQSNSARVNHTKGTGTMPIEMLLQHLMYGMHVEDPSLYFKQFEYKYINNFEVLYIGKSCIKKGNNAFKRVSKHEKLQEILSHVSTNEHHNEVFIMFFNMHESKGIFATKEKFSHEQLKELYKKKDIPKEQLLNIAEACLIRYFEPEYNKNLKKNFPSAELKLLKECYNCDYSAIATEIATEYIGCNTWSKKIPSKARHIAVFTLNDNEAKAQTSLFAETLNKYKIS